MGKYHGRERIYHIWFDMNRRCFNSKSTRYEDYGGRGITVCDEWKDDLEAFYDWAIHSGYQDDLTLDRIDNDGNYEPSNCRWATDKEQSNNIRSNYTFTCNGKTQTVSEWADEFGLNYFTLYRRLQRGWDIKRALLTGSKVKMS